MYIMVVFVVGWPILLPIMIVSGLLAVVMGEFYLFVCLLCWCTSDCCGDFFV